MSCVQITDDPNLCTFSFAPMALALSREKVSIQLKGSAIFGSPGFGGAYIIPTDMPFTASPLQVTVLLPCTLPWVNLGTFKPNALSISAGVKSLQGSTCAVAGNMKASRTNANTAIRRFMYFSYSPFCKLGSLGVASHAGSLRR